MALSDGNMTKTFDMQIKLLMIGDSGVGKTCLLLRYTNDTFSPTFITTIGIDFKVKTIPLLGKHVKLQVWDTAGQERFRTITTSYFRGAQGILLVYDVTDRSSFENVRNWMGQVQQHADFNANKLLVGNKSDSNLDSPESSSRRVVSKAEGEALAREFGIYFVETSAKDNLNIQKAFETVATQVVTRLQNDHNIHGSFAANGVNANNLKNRGARGSASKVDLNSSTDKSTKNCGCM